MHERRLPSTSIELSTRSNDQCEGYFADMSKTKRPRKCPGMSNPPTERHQETLSTRLGLSRMPLPDEPYCESCAWPKRLCVCSSPPSNRGYSEA
jgi:hypothetical protein